MLEPEERERFERVVMPHQDAAFNLARWLLRSRVDAEDVTQEALIRAYRFFAGFHGGDARAWLLQIVRNTCYTWLEKSLMEEFNEELHRRPCATPESMAIAGNDREHLTHALETLSVALSASNRFSPHFMTRGVRSDLLDATSASAGARVGGIDG